MEGGEGGGWGEGRGNEISFSDDFSLSEKTSVKRWHCGPCFIEIKKKKKLIALIGNNRV